MLAPVSPEPNLAGPQPLMAKGGFFLTMKRFTPHSSLSRTFSEVLPLLTLFFVNGLRDLPLLSSVDYRERKGVRVCMTLSFDLLTSGLRLTFSGLALPGAGWPSCP